MSPGVSLKHRGNHDRTTARISESTTRTHLAMYTYDILRAILDECDPYYDEDRMTCASSARVCRAWYEPAIRVLWGRNKWTIFHLYQGLLRYTDLEPWSKSAFGETKGLKNYLSSKVRSVKLRPRSRVPDRERFLHCGSRIRFLDVHNVHNVVRDEKSLGQLLRWSNGANFLPAVQSIRWDERPTTDGLLLRLATASLMRLEILVSGDTLATQMDNLLRRLPDSAPYICELTISWYCWPSRPFPAEAVGANAELRHLFIGDPALSPKDLAPLLMLPKLEILCCRVKDFQTCSEPLDASPALKTLRLTGTCGDLAALISHLSSPMLTHLGLEIQESHSETRHDSYAQRDMLSKEIANRSPASFPVLRSLQIRCWGWATAGVGDNISMSIPLVQGGGPLGLYTEVLQPLLGHLHLTSLCVEDHSPPALLTDDDILRLAQAMPMLQSLTLTSCNRDRTQPVYPTPLALHHLAEHCPHLTFLKIQLDYTPSVVWSCTSHPGPMQPVAHRLRTLILALTVEVMRCPHVLAQLVDRIFPYLDVDSCCEDLEYEWKALWDEVCAMQTSRGIQKERSLSPRSTA